MTWWLVMLAIAAIANEFASARKSRRREREWLIKERAAIDAVITTLPPAAQRLFWREPPKLPPAPKEPLHEEGPFR